MPLLISSLCAGDAFLLSDMNIRSASTAHTHNYDQIRLNQLSMIMFVDLTNSNDYTLTHKKFAVVIKICVFTAGDGLFIVSIVEFVFKLEELNVCQR